MIVKYNKDTKGDFSHKQIEDLHQSWLRQDIKEVQRQHRMRDLQISAPPSPMIPLDRDPVVDLREDFKWQLRHKQEKQIRDGWMKQDLKEAKNNRLKLSED